MHPFPPTLIRSVSCSTSTVAAAILLLEILTEKSLSGLENYDDRVRDSHNSLRNNIYDKGRTNPRIDGLLLLLEGCFLAYLENCRRNTFLLYVALL